MLKKIEPFPICINDIRNTKIKRMGDSNLNIETSDIMTASDYEIQSELNDMRQHANKIIQGIKKLDINDSNRAIWELFQNAVDLSEECNVQIKLTESTFEFSHNGEPFTPMTLDCLFKQVSSKTLEEKKQLYNENDPVGQYGTGFITSHAFGKEVFIDGALIKGNGFIPLNQFKINRFTDNWKELANHIRILKKEVSSLLSNSQLQAPPYPSTKFTYKTATRLNHESAAKALSSLELILPYVMTLNPTLSSVLVTDINGDETVYKKKDSYTKGEIQIRPININGIDQEICYLESENEKVIIILPLTPEYQAFDFDENLPKLFLYYPLIGTQYFGVNFIMNSRQFQPTEPRNGLYLKSDNESNEKDEEANRQLIQKASNSIFEFIRKNAYQINSPIKLATINFNINSDDILLNDYFKNLKIEWINEFKNFPLVETDSGNIKPSEALFLHNELLLDDENFDAIFELANKFWKNIPKKHLTKEWTKKIDEWDIDEIKYININNIVAKIQDAGSLTAFSSHDILKHFYNYLIEQEHTDVFNAYKLLPNIKGEFRQLLGNEGLNSSLNLTDELIEIADVIMPDIPKRHVHPEFKFSLEFTDYSRKNYTTEVNEYITKQIGEKATSKAIDELFLQKLMDYCKIVTSAESTSVPSKIIKLICRYYNQSEELIAIPVIKDEELDNRPPQKRLLRLFLNDISNEKETWIIDNLDFLLEVISIGANYYDYEELFQTLRIFPNQLNELKEQSYLFIDDQILPEIKDLYDKVVEPNFQIRSILVNEDFAEFLKNKQKKTIKDLTEKIESKFFDEQTHLSINEHPFKKEILDILEKIKESSDYEKYFKLIFSKRSSILVDLADGEDTFSILSLDSKRIKKLAELGNNPDFDEIVKLGQEALLKKQQENTNFQHKYTIGTHIESLLRKNLIDVIPENIKADIEDVQDGQDIIIKINEQPRYFIEVKSRWDVNTSIRMSKNQTLRADEQKNNYALCSVDMTKYIGDNKFEVQDIELIKHCITFDNEIGHEVTHLISVLNQTNDIETIHLDGDYRTLVPMKFIDKGLNFDEFEKYLIEFLKKEL